MIPIYERLLYRLPEYRTKYKINIKNKMSTTGDCVLEIIYMFGKEQIMEFYLGKMAGEINWIVIDLTVTENTIDDIRFLLNDLNISDYYYNVYYKSNEFYPDIKPYCLYKCKNKEIINRLDFILDEYEKPRSDKPHVARDPTSLYDLDLKIVKSVCYNTTRQRNINKYVVIHQALSIFKYVFIIGDYNDTAYEMVDGKVVESNMTLFEFEVSIINSMTMTKSAQK